MAGEILSAQTYSPRPRFSSSSFVLLNSSFFFRSAKPISEGAEVATSAVVRDFYSSSIDQGREGRQHSPIADLRAFNNWVKSVRNLP